MAKRAALEAAKPAATTGELSLPAQHPAARFLLVTTPGKVRLYALPDGGEALIGRGSECQVILDHASISRQHARLSVGSTCTLSDLGSRNGTKVGGERLGPGEKREVACGDSFSLGPVSLLLLPPGAGPTSFAAGDSRLRVEDVETAESSPVLSALAQARLGVIIYGETGVGKELLAAALHRASRRAGTFLGVNCAALGESLLENELFGHERGAFTGADQAAPGILQAASGGTVLLDEIGEMSLAVQAKVLRAIETQSVLPLGGVRPVAVDVRFLAATHRNLLELVDGGRFRRDLYYRLAGFTLEITPLRERKHQIVRLAMKFLAAATAQTGAAPPSCTPAAAARLEAHDWPGNVRELRNVMERSLVLANGGQIDVAHLLFDTGAPVPPAAVDDERARIVAALDTCAGNQTRAARALGISRTTLVQKLRLYGIARPRTNRAHNP